MINIILFLLMDFQKIPNFINDINLQNYQTLFEDISYISNHFSLSLQNQTLNDYLHYVYLILDYL